VTYEAHLGYGNIADTIREAATSWACDAIVLGSRGLTGFKRLMLGSISNAVTAKTLLPVLIVKRFLLA
jgi:nucleotide-binding universal stress UspA family protein